MAVPSSQPVSEQILVQLKNVIESIDVANGFFFTPDDVDGKGIGVGRLEPGPGQWLAEKEHMRQIYAIHDDLETLEERASGLRIKVMEVFITGFHRYNPGLHDELKSQADIDILRSTMRQRMKHDIEKIIDQNITLSNLADNLDITDVRSVSVDSSPEPRWAGVEFRLEITYTTAFGDPTQTR